ncbi:GspE/PulE family protein [Desulforhabdus amnigena]|jgi:general secretion pathway protein E|uniref:Type II secretion system protein GspE n=1 Tax=Desulforhabdus amnigena TaxID=40218 RepID=A0A9W6D5V6_9BACT|nr:ATPase, T2SS/T4P/T4SS family [Desulforhabdus amnigena]NLJ26814.1 Flp pilus assembly complex ATPase component TadA [Deltaproteobacteria bacterium]GLI34765.1 type II secretion system protein GspE [Desulforhabdus amnigena]
MPEPMTLLALFQKEFALQDEQVKQLQSSYFMQGISLMDAFEQISITDENRVLHVLADHLQLPLLEREDYPEKPVLLEGVSMFFLRKHSILPIQVESGRVRVVVNNPLNLPVLNILGNYFAGMELNLCLGQREEIRTAIDRLYGTAAREAEALSRTGEGGLLNGDAFEEDLEHLKGLAQEAPIVRLVNILISRALDMRASDIHFEPFEHSFQVRSRVDGVLFDLDQPPKTMQAAIISRLKLMANLNIAERRLPQDGKIKLKFGNRDVDIRVSTVPTIYGESIVLRLLAQEAVDYNLASVGMDPQQLSVLEELIERPFGMILVTGPTGSGKTTTLYGVLRKLNNITRKIITVEDPVEYQINGINQIQVKPQIDLTFANALRSLVRQDPDVLLIGEIRDKETADIAIESALTGHLVLSTLHTNDAPGAITRMRDLGIESFLMADSLLAILAQRLVRVLCPHCKEAYPAREVDMVRMRQVIPDLPASVTLYQNKGCEKCGYTGFRGRQGIFEVLRVSETIRSAIVAEKSAGDISQIAFKESYRPLLHHGYRKVIEGITTMSEVLRVTSLSLTE